ncbi:MAG: dihydrofolate reductase family protein [Bacillota bacterium]
MLHSLIQDIKMFLADLNQKPDKDIWIVGGGNLVQSFLKDDLIDEFRVTIVPKILDDGIPLFRTIKNSIDLKLIQAFHEDDLVMLTYHRKQLAL